jgi:hypothetical protein
MLHLAHTHMVDQSVGHWSHFLHGRWMLSMGARINRLGSSTCDPNRYRRRILRYDLGW